jgi:hypothetical protein
VSVDDVDIVFFGCFEAQRSEFLLFFLGYLEAFFFFLGQPVFFVDHEVGNIGNVVKTFA